jgi:hypothetical protein
MYRYKQTVLDKYMNRTIPGECLGLAINELRKTGKGSPSTDYTNKRYSSLNPVNDPRKPFVPDSKYYSRVTEYPPRSK